MEYLIYFCSSLKSNTMSKTTTLILIGSLLSLGALRIMIYREYVKHIQHYSMSIIVGIVIAIFFTTYCTIKLIKK